MALVECPDCRHSVSADAERCTNCGRPTDGPLRRFLNRDRGIGDIIVVVFVVWLLIWAWSLLSWEPAAM